MLGTEDGRYDASEYTHDALLPVLSLTALGMRTRALRRGANSQVLSIAETF
jgi:hypothetical protein